MGFDFEDSGHTHRGDGSGYCNQGHLVDGGMVCQAWLWLNPWFVDRMGLIFLWLLVWNMAFIFPYALWLFNIAMENGPFIDGLPIINDDFPWLC